jgi:hypothetical protein
MKRFKIPLSILAFSFGIILNFVVTSSISNAVINGLHSFSSMIDDNYDRVSMKCPVIRSPSEGARVSVIFPRNTSDGPILYSVTGRVDYHISYQKILPSEEVLLPPGEELDISRELGKAGPGPSYLVVRIRAQAGGRRPFPSTLREVAYEGRCGIAIVNILGLKSLPILLLTLGIHLIGFTLFKRHAFPRMPESVVFRSFAIVIALLAFIGPVLAMLPLVQTDLLLTVYSLIVYLTLLLGIFLLIGLLFRKIRSWVRNMRNRRLRAS